MVRHTEILQHSTPVYTTAAHSFGEDALLLAAFCRIRPKEAACDLGTGCGILPLWWFDRGHRGVCAAVEQAPEAVELLAAAARACGAENIKPLCDDLRTFRSAVPFDLVSCNPPYFPAGAGRRSRSAARDAARRETLCTLEDVCAAGSRLLKDGGRLCLCQRPERLAQAVCLLHAAHLEPRRLQLVAQTPQSAPWLCLIEARKNRAPGLQMLPILFTRAQNEAEAGRKSR